MANVFLTIVAIFSAIVPQIVIMTLFGTNVSFLVVSGSALCSVVTFWVLSTLLRRAYQSPTLKEQKTIDVNH